MNKKERMKMVTDAGITSDDIDGYIRYLFPEQETEEYSRKETQNLIDKLLEWKQQEKIK